MIKITIADGNEIMIDDEDVSLIEKYRWRIDSQGYVFSQDYNNSTVRLHRVLKKVTDSRDDVDHKDKNKRNNTKDNLRVCSHQQNCFNSVSKMKKPTSLYKGVSWNKTNKNWLCQITVNYRNYHLLCSKSEIEAAYGYNVAVTLVAGEYALLNKIDESTIPEATKQWIADKVKTKLQGVKLEYT